MWIIRPLEIRIGNLHTGRYRLTATSDEDGGGPYGDDSHDHSTPEEAESCVQCNEYCSKITGIFSRSLKTPRVKSNLFNIFLDDERHPKQVTWIDLPLVEWTIIRSYEKFVSFIKENGIPKRISFDNDLDPSHYQYYKFACENGLERFPYENCKIPTGYHCADWLGRYCLDNRAELPYYTTHTMNHFAQRDIPTLLEGYREKIHNETRTI